MLYFIRPASTVVKIPADSYSIALFLKQSSVHMLELTNAFSQVASVKLWQVARNDGSGRDRQMEYRFTPTQVILNCKGYSHALQV